VAVTRLQYCIIYITYHTYYCINRVSVYSEGSPLPTLKHACTSRVRVHKCVLVYLPLNRALWESQLSLVYPLKHLHKPVDPSQLPRPEHSNT